MTKISRRSTIKYITLAGLSTAGVLSSCKSKDASEKHGTVHSHESVDGLRGLAPEDVELLGKKFFTDEERTIVRTLANLVIPADDRSGNAEDAGTVEFIEFMMLDMDEETGVQVKMRGGLNWLNMQCLKKFGLHFSGCSEEQQKEVIDRIAWPDIAPPELSHGVSFFNLFRDFVATGFWTSKIGIDDLQYMGNIPNAWEGAPQPWLDKLGVSYG
jgi:hypothetical protein